MIKIGDGTSPAGINELYKDNKWAYDLFRKSLSNHWVPTTIPMKDDILQWNSKDCLSPDEKLLVQRCLGFFAGAESLVGNNLLINIYRCLEDGDLRQYLVRQLLEESIHNDTIVYICSSLNLDRKEVYQAYKNIPAIKVKDDFLMACTNDMSGKVSPKELIENLFMFYVLCEGIFFYSGFAMLLNFRNQNKLPGIGQQIRYTYRDECVSEDTDILTPLGWKNVKDITYDDLIAQYNKITGGISFTKPSKLSKVYCEQLYNFSSTQRHIDLNVSANHRMLQGYKNLLQEVTAEKASYSRHHTHIMAGQKLLGDKTKLTPKERFLIAFQADGSLPSGEYRNGNRCGYITISFQFTKERKILRFREILKDCGYDYKEFNWQTRKECTYFKVQIAPNSIYKTFAEWVDLTNVNYEWCEDFITELSYWDGHIDKKGEGNRITYGSIIKSNVDIVQAISCLANYRTHYAIRHDTRKETFSDFHKLDICKHLNSIKGNGIKKTTIKYNNYVYGIEVPDSFIVVRRNNAVAITGNSNHIEFGITLLNKLKETYSYLWTAEFELQIIEKIKKAVDLEIAYVHDALPKGVLGLNAEMFIQYMHYIGNVRLKDLGIYSYRFPSNTNPFPWLSEIVELDRNTNFFESQVQNYQTGSIVDDL